jgi:hypothetical protein
VFFQPDYFSQIIKNFVLDIVMITILTASASLKRVVNGASSCPSSSFLSFCEGGQWRKTPYHRGFASSNNGTTKKVTALSLASKKRRGRKITMVTAYDYPSALHVDRAGMDVLLVGDSCAMVELGYDTTQPMTLDQMLHHCQAVKRGASRSLLVADMPFGTYEYSDTDIALRNAYRLIKEAGMDAVKLEVNKFLSL